MRQTTSDGSVWLHRSEWPSKEIFQTDWRKTFVDLKKLNCCLRWHPEQFSKWRITVMLITIRHYKAIEGSSVSLVVNHYITGNNVKKTDLRTLLLYRLQWLSVRWTRFKDLQQTWSIQNHQTTCFYPKMFTQL